MSLPRPEDIQLLRYLNGQSSLEDQQVISRWISEDENNERFVSELQQIWNAEWRLPPELSDDVAQQDWAKIRERMYRVRLEDRTPLSRLMKNSDSSGDRHVSQNKTSAKLRMRRTRLVAGVSLAAIAVVVGLVLTITGKPEIQSHDELAFRTVVAEPGQRVTITLSDGTLIELNSDSKVRLPESFDPDERVVRLTGEAFFDVAPGDTPFRVETPDASIRVLGTAFGLRAYPDENNVELAVAEGLVALVPPSDASDEMVLEAGDAARVDRSSREAIAVNIDMSVFLAWRHGQFAYHDVGLEYVARDLARRYGTDVVVDVPNPSSYSVTARLRARHLDDVAAAITAPLGLEYELMDGSLRIFE